MKRAVSNCKREHSIVGVLILLLSLIEPLTHVWIAFFQPLGTVPSGMHTGDSAIYLHSMASFSNGFHSPFVTCHAEYGADSFRYYTPPHLMLYAVFGAMGTALGIPPFLFLGLINGLGGAVLLLAAYLFFREVMPRLALRAFLLFAFPGGLGGLLFFAAGALGAWQHPMFTEYFERFAHYELIEGQTLSPVLLMPRFYYTVPLALGLAGLTFFVRATREDGRGPALAVLLNAGATALNFRIGPVFWLVASFHVLCGCPQSFRKRIVLLAFYASSTVAGAVLFWWLLQWPPAFTQNALQVTSMALWLVPFLTLTVFHWPFLARALAQGMRALPSLWRMAASGAAGYLLAFTAAYAGYLAYYGNWLRGGDTSATIAVSDWALAGGVLGMLVAWWSREGERPLEPKDAPKIGFAAMPCGRVWTRWTKWTRPVAREEDAEILGWLTLWFLCLLALAPSAFGHEWFLRFTPQRLLVLLGPPLALLTAYGVDGLSIRARRAAMILLVGAGAVSMAAGALFFQGPLGRDPGQGPFAYLHYEVMRPAEAQLLAALPAGTALVPPWSPIAFGEILSLRPNVQVLGGPGAMNLGDQPFDRIQEGIGRFFDTRTDDSFRMEFVRQWCVDFIYCPDTCPLGEAMRQRLDALPWLRRVAQSGLGAVYRVESPP